jgi:hypothetical protein
MCAMCTMSTAGLYGIWDLVNPDLPSPPEPLIESGKPVPAHAKVHDPPLGLEGGISSVQN